MTIKEIEAALETFTTYHVHINESPDGSLPPALWQDIDADCPESAIIEAFLQAGTTTAELPPRAFVATHYHPNGTPAAVRAYKLTVGAQPPTGGF